MKKLFLLAFALCIYNSVHAQDAEAYYNQAIDMASEGKYEESIPLFDKSITLEPDIYVAWYNRGIVKSILERYEEALTDFNQVIFLKPGYKKVYLNRGIAKRNLTDYEGAVADYDYAINLDPEYADAYYNRAFLHQMLGKQDAACAGFQIALDYGLEAAQKKVDKCNDTAYNVNDLHSILSLNKTAKSKNYGFSEKEPIKVGTGHASGPSNQRDYLNLLRDMQGNRIKYERLGSCCGYKSPNGPLGRALLDKYQITYSDESGNERMVTLYMSFYDYLEPMIPQGFKTVQKP